MAAQPQPQPQGLPKLAGCKMPDGPMLPFFPAKDREYEMRRAGLIITREDGWCWKTAERDPRFGVLNRLIARQDRMESGRTRWAREYCAKQMGRYARREL